MESPVNRKPIAFFKQKKVWIPLAVISVLVVIGIASAVGGGSESEPTTSAQSEDERENERKGFHCLSEWDGNHEGLEALIRDNLNDPGSMDTLETRITPVNEDGLHGVSLEFTAKNAFGGNVRHEATGFVDNDTCEATLLSIE